MADDLLLAQYNTSPTVRERNLGSLVVWSSYETAQPLPPTAPAEDWVRQRIVAERVPLQAQSYVERTLAYFMQDPAVRTGNLSEWLSSYNGTEREAVLSDSNGRIIAGFIARFAAQDVSDEQVNQWLLDHYPGMPPA